MLYNYLLDRENRISILVPKFTDEDFGIIDLPDNEESEVIDFAKYKEYTVQDGKLVYVGKSELRIQREVKQLAKKEIRELREKLASLDYVDNKLVEALASGNTSLYDELRVKYAGVFAEKQGYRDRINELEALI